MMSSGASTGEGTSVALTTHVLLVLVFAVSLLIAVLLSSPALEGSRA
jgi:hypothetical protein